MFRLSFATPRPIKPLLVGAAVAGTLLVAACGQKPATTPAASPTPVASAPVTAQAATRGDIQQTLAYSGDIRAREQVSVLPKNSGRVEQVLVDVGSKVQAGDTIAVLDQDNPQAQLLLARATLAQAQAKMTSLQGGPRSEDVAAAQAAVAQQQARLQNMRTGGRSEDIMTAEAALSAAQAKMDALMNGADDGVRQAEQSAVDSDTAALASAEAGYAALGASNAASLQNAQSQIDTLQAQINTAQAQIASADAAIANLGGSSAADVQAAQGAYDQANSQLQTAQAAVKQNFNPTQAAIAQAEAAIEAARSQRAAAEANQTALEQKAAGACASSPLSGPANSTACGEAKAAASAAVTSADTAIEAAQGQLDLLKRGGAPALQTQLQATVDQAQTQVNTTRARLDALKGGGVAATRAQADAQKQQAQGQLVQSQQSLMVAQANLAAANRGNLDAQVKSAASQVIAANERLKSDQAKLDVTYAGPTDQDVQQAQAGIDQATQQLQKAKTPYTSYDLSGQEQAVGQARAQLDKAQNPYTDQDMAAAQAAVDQAQAQLDIAALGLKETTVYAPVDGVISERLVSPGALVNPQTPIATLVRPALELVVNVEESQLGQVAEGQPVQLQVPAFPTETFTGTVRSISPTVDTKSRTAAVRIEPNDDGSKLRAGMFARLSIVTAENQNALVVPREAVLIGAPGSAPLVIAIDPAGRVHRQPVKLGLQSDRLIEISSGIDDGQLVATSSLNDLTDGDVVSPQIEIRTALAR